MAEIGPVLSHQGGAGDPGARTGCPGATCSRSRTPTTRTSTPPGCSRSARRRCHARGGFPAVVVAKTAVLLAAFAAGVRALPAARRGAGRRRAGARRRGVRRPRTLRRSARTSSRSWGSSVCCSRSMRWSGDRASGRARVAAVTLRPASRCGPTCTRAPSSRPSCWPAPPAGARLDRDRGGAAGRLGLAALRDGGRAVRHAARLRPAPLSALAPGAARAAPGG